MHQGLAGGPRQEGSHNVGIGDIGQLVSLPGEAPDVLTMSFSRLLSVVFEIPQVPKTRVGAVKVFHKNLL